MLNKKAVRMTLAGKLLRASAAAATLSLLMSGGALAASGWVIESGSWHFLNSNGSYATDQFKRSGNNYFYLDSNLPV